MKELLKALGNPEKGIRAIHIAGTNGKGSTGIMIASILEKAGFSVGLFTSPHLVNENERIQLWNGRHEMIASDKLRELTAFVRAKAEGLHVFEEYTAAAYLYFAERRPDYVILECGLGGRLDSTNTIEKPLVSVITKVSLDHTGVLGGTILRIAREKAGIIKPGVPVVSQTMDLTVKNILERTAAQNGCSFVDVSVLVDEYRGYVLGMRGEHQIRNAATAVEAIRAAGISVPEEAVVSGLSEAVNPGRFELLTDSRPFIILDGAHNPDAMEALTDTFNAFLREHKIRRSTVIFGCMRDKDSVHMIQLLTNNLRGCRYITAAAAGDRAEAPEALGQLLADNGKGCLCCESAEEAYREALASGAECILVTGSIYLAGEMRTIISRSIS